jgi:ATP-dependent helicase/nuclease subunit A
LIPNFRVADETEIRLLKIEALNEVFEEQYEFENPDFFKLLEYYGGNRDDQPLQDLVMNLYDYVRSIPWPEEWLNRMCDMLNIRMEPIFHKHRGESDYSYGKA